MNGLRRRLGAGWRAIDERLVRRIVKIGAVAFVFGFLTTAAIMWLGAARRSVVTVPELRAMPLAQARRALGRADLELELGDSLPNPEVPQGAVLAQSPPPGREVAPGSPVRVILSTGRERRAVPQVATLSTDQALRLLGAYGFRVQVARVPDARAAGRIVGTQPAAGSVVRVPAVIRLLISAGPPPVAVPDLSGAMEADVARLLSTAGLRVGELRREFRPDLPEGQVLAQSRAPGDSATAGSTVDVVVATPTLLGEPEPEPVPAPEEL